jgi:protein translocase SecG subunit
VLLQTKSADAGGLFGGGGGGGNESFYQRRRGAEKGLFVATIIATAIFIVLSVLKILI